MNPKDAIETGIKVVVTVPAMAAATIGEFINFNGKLAQDLGHPLVQDTQFEEPGSYWAGTWHELWG